MKFILKFLGFGTEQQAISRVMLFLRGPKAYYTLTAPATKDELVAVLTLFIRFWAVAKLALLFPFSDSVSVGLAVGLIFFARQCAIIDLWFNALLLNVTAKAFLNPGNSLAASQSYVPSKISPDISTLLLSFVPILDKYMTVFQAFLVIIVLQLLLSNMILVIGLVKTYPMMLWRAIGTAFVVAVFPLILLLGTVAFSIEFDPFNTRDTVDITILNPTVFQIDSSHDGSQYVINDLLLDGDTSGIGLIDSLARCQAGLPDQAHISKLLDFEVRVRPALKATYFNHGTLQFSPQMDLEDSAEFAVFLDRTFTIKRYTAVWRISIRYYLESAQFYKAVSLANEAMHFWRILGQSDVGLVPTLLSVASINRVNSDLAKHLPSMSSLELLGKTQVAVEDNLPDPEWVFNAIRFEHRLNMNTLEKAHSQFGASTARISDSLGLPHIPYFHRKYLDFEDSRRIKANIISRILHYAASVSDSNRVMLEFPDLEGYKQGMLGFLKLAMGKNILGRVFLGNIPVYNIHINASRKNERFAWFLRESCRLKQTYISNPGGCDTFVPETGRISTGILSFNGTTCVLVSKGTMEGDTAVYSFRP